jgi:polyisoprenoid-binding protein YceI
MRKVALLTVILAMGCAKDPTAGKEKAAVGEAAAATPPPSPGGSVTRMPLSPASGKIGFVGAKVTAKHEGKFEKFTGAVLVDHADLSKSAVTVNIDLSSMSIEPAKLAKHLMSDDFFDVEKFGQASFQSTAIAPAGDGKPAQITGNLDLHGVKKSITFPADIQATKDSVKVKAEFAINRKDFGIVYPGAPDDLIKDDVLIQLDLTARP